MQQASHILHMNHWACAIKATLQLLKCTQMQSHFVCGSHWNISINFVAYITIFSPDTIHSMNVWKISSLFPQRPMAMQFPPTKAEKKGMGTKR